jgi:chromosome segregation ATPase
MMRSEKVCVAVKAAIIKVVEDSAFATYRDLQNALALAQATYVDLTKDKGPAATVLNDFFLQECKVISDSQQLRFKVNAAEKDKADSERKREEERVKHNLMMQQNQNLLQAQKEKNMRDSAAMKAKQDELNNLLKAQEAESKRKQIEMQASINALSQDRAAAQAKQRELQEYNQEQQRQRQALEVAVANLRNSHAQLQATLQAQQPQADIFELQLLRNKQTEWGYQTRARPKPPLTSEESMRLATLTSRYSGV